VGSIRRFEAWPNRLKLTTFLLVGILIGSVLSSLGDPGPTKAEADPISSANVSPSPSPSPTETTTPSPSPSPTQTASPSPSPRPKTDGTNATVSRVVDGDTIETDFRGSIIDIRLIGVDTPETVHPSEPIECYGPAASKFTTRALEGERVRLEFDVERQDRYGRTLAYVWLNGKLFNQRLVRAGFANVSTFPPNVKYVASEAVGVVAAEVAAEGTATGLPIRVCAFRLRHPISTART
jgi:endonuclease YncB( thermonuclease family)